MKERFDSAYAAWRAHVKSPAVAFHSDSKTYIDCPQYLAIAALGPQALPYLAEKISQGEATGWSESEFFLWHAMRSISGVDLSQPYQSEQGVAAKYARWWVEQHGK